MKRWARRGGGLRHVLPEVPEHAGPHVGREVARAALGRAPSLFVSSPLQEYEKEVVRSVLLLAFRITTAPFFMLAKAREQSEKERQDAEILPHIFFRYDAVEVR